MNKSSLFGPYVERLKTFQKKFEIFREIDKLPWHRRPSQFSAISDRETDEGEEEEETEPEVTRRGAGKVKFGQPETETETEEAEASAHAFEKPMKKKKHARKKRLMRKILSTKWRAMFLKNGPYLASFSIIFGLFKQTSLQFLQQINVKIVHPVYGAGIRTHNLQNVSLFP